MGPGRPLRPTGKWPVSSCGFGGEEGRVGTHSLSLDLMAKGQRGEGLPSQVPRCRSHWSLLTWARWTCLLSGKRPPSQSPNRG